MTDTLTKSERQTIDNAFNIILAHAPVGSSWQLYVSNYKGIGVHFSACYFDSVGEQHSNMNGTPSEVIAKAIGIEAHAERDAEKLRMIRIERLHAELANLTGEVAA